MNRRLERYCSLLPDHRAYVVNAYSTNLRNLNPFLHPPIPQILRTFVKVQKDKADAAIIIPDWKYQICDQLLREIIVKEVVLGRVEEVPEKGRTMTDKHLEGEQLFKRMAKYIGLDSETIKNIINAIIHETWRKRHAGLHLFNKYLNEKKLELSDILNQRADVVLANSLTWREKQEEKSKLEDLTKMRTHVGIALSMFSEYSDQVVKEKEIMRKSMILFIAFNGARMTELANISRQDIVIGEEEMKVKMIIKKRKKPVPFDDPFQRRERDFGGSTVRHAMITKLRSEGVSLKAVNEFTKHQENSN
ncbi:MAG: hypothetical protein EZS28_006842 [Streblomastix strix]|uniref:Tyr recombinase domain-containing protein n=1 Tax=Streblomastix strix TaxID=222440 RepID=A0A5J4WS56_9EUKA|nr:MAG: hypothetical protein EZS28_006842 [Streblomastix strix]